MSNPCSGFPCYLPCDEAGVFMSFWWGDENRDWEVYYNHEFSGVDLNDISRDGPWEWSSVRVER